MLLEIGGLQLLPRTIGIVIGGYGAGGAIFQALFFAKVVRRFGERRIFITAIATYLPVFIILPVANLAARHLGQQSIVVWALVGLVVTMMALNDIAFGTSRTRLLRLCAFTDCHALPSSGTIFMYITSSAPNKRSLGATNGLSQTSVSIARAVGPALATSLFSFSVQMNLLGGYAVYAFFAALSCFAVVLSTRLPEKVWDDQTTSN